MSNRNRHKRWLEPNEWKTEKRLRKKYCMECGVEVCHYDHAIDCPRANPPKPKPKPEQKPTLKRPTLYDR